MRQAGAAHRLKLLSPGAQWFTTLENREVVRGADVAWIETEAHAVALHGLVVAPEAGQGVAAVVIRLGVASEDGDGSFVFAHRAKVVALRRQERSVEVMT